MRVLVTGITGFAGPYVADALRVRGHAVHALVRGDARDPGPPQHLEAAHRADLTDPAAVDAAVAAAAPEAIVHLGGWSDPAAAEHEPEAVYRVNLHGTLALLAAVRARTPQARLLVVSSLLVYGAVLRRELPVREDTPLRPLGVYGASKAAAEIAALQWSRAYGLDVVVARPFNHTGAGQRSDFVCAAIARQLAAVEAGRQEPVLRLGNLDPVRDFSDVRDIAAGYVALLERGRRGEAYNLCSGEGVSVAEVVALLRTIARVPVHVRSDPGRRRALDPERFVGTYEKARADTGWCPGTPLLATLGWVLDDWRARETSRPGQDPDPARRPHGT